MWMRTIVVLLAGTTFLASRADAAEYAGVDLPALVGAAPAYGDSISVEFDLGREFTSVHRVLLVLRAHTTPGVLESCGYMYEPEPCTTGPLHIGFLATLPAPGLVSSHTAIEGFGSSFGGERAGIFQLFGSSDYEHLHDGQGTLTLGWNGVSFIPEALVTLLEAPTGFIEEATLIAEVTPVDTPVPVPEPPDSAAALAAVGSALAMRLFSHRHRRA